jgi:hypothetical protein
MLTGLAALVALACVLASARRLVLAVSPTRLDPKLIVDALRAERGVGRRREIWTALRHAIAACDDATWEQDLLAAVDGSEPRSRIALVNEQLRELDWRAQRWVRVPRVCASVATSAGFLFACIALLRGLALPAEDAGAAFVPALDALAVGIAGTSFCFAVHLRAQRVVRERLSATDRLVDLLEATAGEAPVVDRATDRREDLCGPPS